MHPYYTERMLARPGRARPHRRHRLAHPRARRRLRLPPRPHRDRDPGHRPAARRRLRVPGHDRTPRPPPRPHRQAGGRRAARRRAGRPPRRRSRRRRARRRRPATRQAPHRPRRAHAPRDRSADPDRPGRLDPPGRATADHHPEDGRDPHRADLRQDRRHHPLDGHACSPCSTACSAPSSRSICRGNPGRRRRPPSVRSIQQRITDTKGATSWPARQSSASAPDSRTPRRS